MQTIEMYKKKLGKFRLISSGLVCYLLGIEALHGHVTHSKFNFAAMTGGS